MEWYFGSFSGQGQWIHLYALQPPDGVLFCGTKPDDIPSLETALEGISTLDQV